MPEWAVIIHIAAVPYDPIEGRPIYAFDVFVRFTEEERARIAKALKELERGRLEPLLSAVDEVLGQRFTGVLDLCALSECRTPEDVLEVVFGDEDLVLDVLGLYRAKKCPYALQWLEEHRGEGWVYVGSEDTGHMDIEGEFWGRARDPESAKEVILEYLEYHGIRPSVVEHVGSAESARRKAAPGDR